MDGADFDTCKLPALTVALILKLQRSTCHENLWATLWASFACGRSDLKDREVSCRWALLAVCFNLN